MKEFLFGLGLGMVAGAYLVKNCKQAKDLVDKSSKMIKDKVEDVKQKSKKSTNKESAKASN